MSFLSSNVDGGEWMFAMLASGFSLAISHNLTVKEHTVLFPSVPVA
jgi:hypothetical protein